MAGPAGHCCMNDGHLAFCNFERPRPAPWHLNRFGELPGYDDGAAFGHPKSYIISLKLAAINNYELGHQFDFHDPSLSLERRWQIRFGPLIKITINQRCSWRCHCCCHLLFSHFLLPFVRIFSTSLLWQGPKKGQRTERTSSAWYLSANHRVFATSKWLEN